MTDIAQLQAELLATVEAAAGLEALEAARVHALGKQGVVTALLKTLGGMTPDERQAEGPRIHGLREAVTSAHWRAQARPGSRRARRPPRRRDAIDVTLPLWPASATGTVHPVSQVMDELAEIFADLGFAVATGPEIEDDWHNFTALNIPETHPARAMHDTFYFPDRARTGPEDAAAHAHLAGADPHDDEQAPPIRIIAPGRTYRSDQRRHAHADVPSGGGAGDRQGHPPRPSQMDAGDVPQGVLRARRHRAAPAPELFPVHRALGRGGCRLYPARTASASSADPRRAETAGWKCWAPAWSTAR